MTLFGVDLSDYDMGRGPVNVAAMAADGITFLTHKATESTNTRHVNYGPVLSAARAAGIPFLGAYIVPRTPGSGGAGSVDAQVAYFLSWLDSQTPWWRSHPGWMMQVDLERWSYDSVSPATGLETCAAIQRATGKRPLLYAPQWAYASSPLPGYPLWASAYVTGSGPYRGLYPGDADARWGAYSGQTPAIWQYSSSAVVDGQPGCDVNAFRGTRAELGALLGQPGEQMLKIAIVDGKYFVGDGVWRRSIVDWPEHQTLVGDGATEHDYGSDAWTAFGAIGRLDGDAVFAAARSASGDIAALKAAVGALAAAGTTVDTAVLLAKMDEIAAASISRDSAHAKVVKDTAAAVADALTVHMP